MLFLMNKKWYEFIEEISIFEWSIEMHFSIDFWI